MSLATTQQATLPMLFAAEFNDEPVGDGVNAAWNVTVPIHIDSR